MENIFVTPMKRIVTLSEFSISRHQILCAHATVVQRMHTWACKLPFCFAEEDSYNLSSTESIKGKKKKW